jgi:hypothetical protein
LEESITYEHVLNKVAIDSGEKFKKLMFAIAPLYKDNSPLPDEIQYPLIQLFSSLIESLESLIILTSFGRIWDAKLLGRIVAEGFLKFLYTFRGGKGEILTKLNEYLNIIPSINRIKLHNTAKEFLDKVKVEPFKHEALLDTLLDEEEIRKFKEANSDKDFNKIFNKWSNNGLLISLKNDLMPDLYVSLVYDYKLSSQIAHIDADILMQKKDFSDDMCKGIYTRPISFGASTLANSLTIMLICTLEFLHLQGIDPENFDKELTEYHNEIKKLHEIAEKG